MCKFISCGEFNKKYICILIAYIIFNQLPYFALYFFVFNHLGDTKDELKKDDNISLIPLMTYIGQAIFFIPELIIQKNLFKNQNNIQKSKTTNDSIRKSLALEYIFNENISDTIECIDIFYIFLISFLTLIIDIIKITIQIKNKDFAERKLFNDEYNFLQLIFLFIYSIYSYRTKFYKHQYYPFILIILIGILRYIIKLYECYLLENNLWQIILNLIIQIIIAGCETFTILYSKGLMKYKYFSPYKACYIFGFINGFFLLIILFILSFIKCNPSLLICSLHYKGNYYIDNIFNIFSKYNWYQFIIIFVSGIFMGSVKVLINVTINSFSIFHIYLLFQIKEFGKGILEEMDKKANSWGIWIAFFSYFPEIFLILVFLELIELKFCGLNKNMKKNIEKRAIEEVKLLGEDEAIQNPDDKSNDGDNDEEKDNNNVINEIYGSYENENEI